MATEGGPIRPVVVIEDSDLKENGGEWVVRRGPALRVEGFADATTRPVQGGAAMPVYIVSEGSRVFLPSGNAPIPVGTLTNLGITDRPMIGRTAIPVLPTSPLWPQIPCAFLVQVLGAIPNSTSYTQEADFLIEFILGGLAGLTNFSFRRQNAGNTLRLTVAPVTFTLVKRVAAVDTVVASFAAATDGTRINIVGQGSTVKVYYNDALQANTIIPENATNTIVFTAIATNNSLEDLIIWPICKAQNEGKI